MRILAAADIHGDKKLIKKLASDAEKKDVSLVVLCGDITFIETELEGIIGPFLKKGKKVILIPGNHETVATADFLVKLYGEKNVKNLHGYSVMFTGDKGEKIGFFGCGSGNVGMFTLPDDKIEDLLKEAHKKIKKAEKKIMVTHIPPFKTKVDDLGWTNAGSIGIKKAIKKLNPDICLCGHIHETAGIEDKIGKTRVINVGKEGKIIEI